MKLVEYALEFKGSGYKTDIDIFKYTERTYGFTCTTFRTSGDNTQTLISNYEYDEEEDYCDISVTSTGIDITLNSIRTKVKKVFPIQHDCSKWTTFFLEYIPLKNKAEFRYLINNDHKLSGSFDFPLANEVLETNYSIGCRFSEPFQYFQGDIASLDVYCVSGIKDGQSLPTSLKELVIKNQLLIDYSEQAVRKRQRIEEY